LLFAIMISGVGVQQDITLEHTGTKVDVPYNNMGKLMYYLNCVNCCLDHFITNSRLTTYGNYNSLSNDEQESVMVLCALLSPDLLNNRVFFPLEDNSPILRGSNNTFFKITEATHVIAAAATADEAIMIEGKKVDINQFMVYELSWLRKYYYEPLSAEIRRHDAPAPAPAKYVYIAPSPSRDYEYTSSPSHVAWWIFCFGFCFSIAWLMGSGFACSRSQRGGGVANLIFSLLILAGLGTAFGLLYRQPPLPLVEYYLGGAIVVSLLIMICSCCMVKCCYKR